MLNVDPCCVVYDRLSFMKWLITLLIVSQRRKKSFFFLTFICNRNTHTRPTKQFFFHSVSICLKVVV